MDVSPFLLCLLHTLTALYEWACVCGLVPLLRGSLRYDVVCIHSGCSMCRPHGRAMGCLVWWHWRVIREVAAPRCHGTAQVYFEMRLGLAKWRHPIWNVCRVAISHFSLYNSRKAPHGWPTRMSCGVSSVSANLTKCIILTHWDRDKMDDIYQMTFSNAFYWMKVFQSRLIIHWSA